MSPLDIGQDDSNNGSNAAETEETFAPEIEVGENDDAENEETIIPDIQVEENGDEENALDHISVGLVRNTNGRNINTLVREISQGQRWIFRSGGNVTATIGVVTRADGVAIEIIGSNDMRSDGRQRFGVMFGRRRNGPRRGEVVEYTELLSSTDVPVLFLSMDSVIVSFSHNGEILDSIRLYFSQQISPLPNRRYVFVPHDEAETLRRQRRLGNREEDNNNNADAEVDDEEVTAAEMNDEDVELDGGGELADVEIGAEVAADAEMDIEAIEEDAAGEQHHQQHPQAYLGNMVRVNIFTGERMDEDED
jgi:hypothetical protein